MEKSKEKRQRIILSLLQESDYIVVKELPQMVEVSEMTVRRDIRELYKKGKVQLVNGVLMSLEGKDEKSYHLQAAKDRFLEEKRKIGKCAADLIDPGDTIALDLGSTTEQMIRYIPNNFNITVICNALNILLELRKKNIKRIIFAGGFYRESTQVFESEEFLHMIRKYRTNKAFISAAGFSGNLGITCVNAYEAPYKQAIMEGASEKILLFDASKYNVIKAVYFADVKGFTQVITNTVFTAEDEELFFNNNITIKGV